MEGIFLLRETEVCAAYVVHTSSHYSAVITREGGFNGRYDKG